TRKNDARVHSGGRVFIEPRAQICLALRLKQVMKNSHLGFVVRAAFDLLGAIVCQLAISRFAIATAVEPRTDAEGFDSFCSIVLCGASNQVRLAIEAARRT